MSLPILLAGFLPALLVAAAIFDLTTYTIPNLISASMTTLFGVFLLAMALQGSGLTLSGMGFHLLAGLTGLVAGMLFFAFGWVGGGDAKLFATAALWLGWDALFEYALLAALLGGCLTLMLILLRHMPLPPILAVQPWIARLADRRGGVPYGVAIALAALTMWPGTELFRIAATS